MTDSPESKKTESKQLVDLSALKSLDFKPAWDNKQQVSGGQGSTTEKRFTGDRKPRDRRSKGVPQSGQSGAGSSDRPRRDKENKFNKSGNGPRNNRGGDFAQFKPTVKVYVTPDEMPFRKLIKVMRSSCRTYELFDIAKIILEKPERYIINIEPLDGKENDNKEPFYVTNPDKIPFLTENEAISFVIKNYAENYFTVEETEQEAPKGSFNYVNRCSITGELLAPPNYHRYNEILQEHCSTNGLEMERVAKSIEQVSDPEVIQEWLTKMTKQKVYVIKDRQEGEPESFSSLESAKNFLAKSRSTKIYKRGSRAKINGNHFDLIPEGDIKKSVKAYLDSQARFPLDTATGLRVRLRKMNFSIFKKSAKNISFVCSVKRKQTLPQSGFAPGIQALIEFIEANPEIKNSDLIEKYLGLTIPVVAEGEEAPAIPEEDQQKLKQLKMDLYWLVSEGYVTEYADGKLVAVKLNPVKESAPVEAPVIAKTEAVAEVPAENVAAIEATAEPEVVAEAPEISDVAPAEATPVVADETQEEEAPAPAETTKDL
jgi:hypothetical protein